MSIVREGAFVALSDPVASSGFECFHGGANMQAGGIMRGAQLGLWGQSRDAGPVDLPSQVGVFGTALGGPGVVGMTNTSHGVYGQFRETGGDAPPAGVCGSARLGFGVVGVASQLVGVLGLADRSAGVWGSSNQSLGVGGLSERFHGIFGVSKAPPAPRPADSPAGVYGQSIGGSFGVLGVADLDGTAVAGIATRDAPYAGYFEGDVVVTRDLYVKRQIFATIKDAMVPFPDGSKRVLHCMESPEHWFEDFGSARLTRGRATVKLDADFAKVVKLNEYRVFVTPEGDCQGLYVRNKGGTSFEVHELQGGTSNVAFSYRIIAKRKDIKAHTRFAKIDTTLPMPTAKARAARGRKAARSPSSIRKLLAATAIPMPTRKPRARGRKAARLPSSIRKLLAAQKRARKAGRKPAVAG